MKNWRVFFHLTLFVIILVACSTDSSNEINSNNSEGNKNDNAAPEDVTLIIGTSWPDWMLEERVSDHIEDVYPHITIEHQLIGSKEDLEELISNQIIPDMFHGLPNMHGLLEDMELLYGLDELIEKSSFDLEIIESVALDSIRAQDDEEELWGIPYQGAMYGLFYNKHIFDMFGIDYPTDDMTWNEVVNLARQVTGERNGIQYRGIEIETPNFLIDQFGVNATDPDTGNVLIAEEPAFQRTAELIKEIISIPGIYDPDKEEQREFFTRNGFAEGETAMVVTWGAAYEWLHDSDILNFDGVTMPVWEDIPKTDPMSVVGGPFTISPYSDHKETALSILEYFMTDEYQEWAAEIGLKPIIANPSEDLIGKFGSKLEDVEGKNVAALFRNTPAAPPEKISRWDQYVNIGEAFNDFINNNQDVNTFLRELQEQSEINVENAQQQN